MNKQTLKQLFQGLNTRPRPEDVVELLEQDPAFMEAVKSSHKTYYWSSMSGDFKRITYPARQVRLLEFLTSYPELVSEEDPEAINQLLQYTNKYVERQPGRRFRLTKKQRQQAGLTMSRRQYNKIFRLSSRLEQKQEKLINNLQQRQFTQISKSMLACQISWEDFSKDENTAAFIAYYAARCNLRSEFINGSQQRPFNQTASNLFELCVNSKTTQWYVIAHVFPDPRVLAQLSDEEKGQLVGHWHGILQKLAIRLEQIWNKNEINKLTMIVKRGNDSSSWNETAGAWNKARQSYMALMYELGLQETVEQQWPCKVLRLMAADVASWHRRSGGALDPNTDVWNKLPLPWEIFQRKVQCTRQHVEKVCEEAKLDPVTSGWTGPSQQRQIAACKPTPELVHGVSIGSPQLASILRKAGVFSGKKVKPEVLKQIKGKVEIVRDQYGAAIYVAEV